MDGLFRLVLDHGSVCVEMLEAFVERAFDARGGFWLGG